ncbi:MAG: SMI1/KNR4 family protein [Polyangiaceae bacterium]|jgi:hypothetical protein|nr:SMI1/KNR4 family protein [Polyangiaceae bacterium]
MTDDELIDALRHRIQNPNLRTDVKANPSPFFPPVEWEAVVHAEAALGLTFPPLLSRLYREVGNGGFGPESGMVGLSGGHVDSSGQTLVELYGAFRTEGWPRPLLPLWEWGGPAWACVDTRSSEGKIVTEDESGATLTAFDLHSWLESWLLGVNILEKIYEIKPMFIANPFTGKPVETKRQGRAIGVPIDFAEDMRE